ncbi:MAG: RsmG family class I SAM-dependent methyltransferase [Thermoanaerobaculia bacterium]|nr:RsmG family class I SAM-dependent methyltransferase [Thermoanaerobaculia bacterium]
MGAELPEIGVDRFAARLAQVSPRPLGPEVCARLHLHYQELARWNPRLSLVGPGTREEIVERHYGESLAALPWLEEGDRTLVDVGSGAGFPGLVLAAACPRLDVTLVEARERKWAFLRAAAARCELSVRCVNATVGAALPDEVPRPVDLATVRAVRLGAREAEALAAVASARGRLWAWTGRQEPGNLRGWSRGRQLPLAGSRYRRLIEYRPSSPKT